jgi:hypothetical protein
MGLKSTYDEIAASPGPIVDIEAPARTEIGVSELPSAERLKTNSRHSADIDQYGPALNENG